MRQCFMIGPEAYTTIQNARKELLERSPVFYYLLDPRATLTETICVLCLHSVRIHSHRHAYFLPTH